MIAAESLGLQTCLIGHIIYQEENMNKLLNVSGDAKLVIGITVGYAKEKGNTPKKVNRCYDETYNVNKVKQGL
jgi:nitroreductase